MESEKRAVKDIITSKHFKEASLYLIKRISKNNKAAEAIRKQGNAVVHTKVHDSQILDDAWKLYSMSAAVAESNSAELAMAYSNRSAILTHMSKFEASIMDIDRALNITQSDYLRAKLMLRKVKCLHALNRDEANCKCVLEEVERVVEKIPVPILRELFDKEIKQVKFMLNLPQFHVLPRDEKPKRLKAMEEKYPVNDFSSVEIQSNKKYGRYLTATRNIKPGEVIYIEEPFIQCLNVKKLHAYCSHCFKTTWANIPCDHCSWTMFCSEECKKDAWDKYHDIECAVYACAKDDEGNDSTKQMAIRAMILALKEYGGIKKLEAQLMKWDECTDTKEAFFVNGEVKGNGFKSMYMMSGHVTPKLFKKHKKDTVKVLRSLGKNTSFFGNNFEYNNVESYKNNENVLFLGALFLKLSKICEINGFQMWNNTYTCRSKIGLNFLCWMNECCSRGLYIAPVTSLINHSCNPNANRCFSNDHKVILHAVQPIKKGAQVFHSYQEVYWYCPKKIRQGFLSHIYNFSCECAACQGDWPLYNELYLPANVEIPIASAALFIKSQYEDLINSILLGHGDYDEKVISKLRIGVELSWELLPQPVSFTIALIKCLSIIFEKLYGIWLSLPRDCNPV